MTSSAFCRCGDANRYLMWKLQNPVSEYSHKWLAKCCAEYRCDSSFTPSMASSVLLVWWRKPIFMWEFPVSECRRRLVRRAVLNIAVTVVWLQLWRGIRPSGVVAQTDIYVTVSHPGVQSGFLFQNFYSSAKFGPPLLHISTLLFKPKHTVLLVV